MANDGIDAGSWMLTIADQTSVMTKHGANRLMFAVLLSFYRAHGRFPKASEEIDGEAVALVARQLGLEPEDRNPLDMASRTWKRHCAEIRSLLGFREATVADTTYRLTPNGPW
jgi:hypothetical protein